MDSGRASQANDRSLKVIRGEDFLGGELCPRGHLSSEALISSSLPAGVLI